MGKAVRSALCAVALAAVTLLVVTGSRGAGSPARAASASSPCGLIPSMPAHRRVVWFIFENHSFSQIIGNPAAPYFNELADECGLATRYFAVTHPSLPNYIAMVANDTYGIADDNSPSTHPLGATRSLFGLVRSAGKTWRVYAESMPSNCYPSPSGQYAVKHNPAPYFTAIAADCAQWDVPMGTLASGAFVDDVDAGTLPDFAIVVPNLCNDMHDCPVATGDAWLRSWLTLVLAGPNYAANDTEIVVTFDEGTANDNRIATIVISPATPAGARSTTKYTHYSLFYSTARILGIGDFRDLRTRFGL